MMDIEQFKNNTNRISNAEIEEKENSRQSQIKTCEQRILEFYHLQHFLKASNNQRWALVVSLL